MNLPEKKKNALKTPLFFPSQMKKSNMIGIAGNDVGLTICAVGGMVRGGR